MVWERIKRLFGRKDRSDSEIPEVSWIEAGENPWGVRVVDVRPVTQNMLSTSTDQACANNAVSFGGDDGTSFIGQEPAVDRSLDADLTFPIDRLLADGALFTPMAMEHKWAIYCHRGHIIFIRSWLRQVQVVARIEAHGDHVRIVEVRGVFGDEDEDPALTVKLVDYLLRSHALGNVYPTPLPGDLGVSPEDAAMWCMSMFGNMSLIATPHEFERTVPEKPLRSDSLLHIGVARGDAESIETSLASGIPVDLLASDGLAPLHWSFACEDSTMTQLLLDKGSPVDARSIEGATPLMNAAQNGSVEKAAILLDHGADADARDLRGFTALHRSAEMGHAEIVELLLSRGATVDPEAEGHTPISLARAREEERIVTLLSGTSSGAS